MREVCYSVAMSLDGYVAGPEGEHDWITVDPDIDFAALFGGFDAVLVGRKSYEAALRMGGGVGMPGMEVHVFSRTLRPADCPDVQLSDDAGATVRELKTRPGKDLWLFGGGELFRSLLEGHLVDRVQVAIVPLLLGGGVPMLAHPATRSRLRLTGHSVYPQTGTVLLDYDVAPRA
jgi:dihydrofolate reductase